MKRNLRIHHNLSELGLEKISPGEIRVEALERRFEPRVPFPHRHAFVQLCWISRGRGWHEIDFVRYPVARHTLFVMKPGQVHDWKMSRDTRGVLVEFDAGAFASDPRADLLAAILRAPDRLMIADPARLDELLDLMRTEFARKEAYYELALEAELRALLIFIAREAPAPTRAAAGNDLARKFQALVEKNYAVEHRVEDYARRLGLTAKALTMRLTRTLRQSPRKIIQDRVLLEAKRLLTLTDLSVGEVARELGLEDANYFTRLFRAKLNLTPSEFRARHRYAMGIAKQN
ncbi:MAG: helix-turn-helix domain-containing protein [Bdellovibrionaceae bacterium]|nr:helix-turn-helix domain-containing protein [Pseudobdellovibrionaceae bacterium]